MMPRTGSVSQDVLTTQLALKGVTAPEHVRLREQDQPFFRAIIEARAVETWNKIDLTHAANLARTQADIERVQTELDSEGFTLINDRGTTVQNPKFSILETLSRRAVLLSKALQVHAHATVGESREQVKRNQTQAKALKNAKTTEDDDLFARPH